MTNSAARTALRLVIASWPEEARHGAVAAFCREHGVSRDWFYKTRKRLADEGLPDALSVQTTRPKTSPNRVSEDLVRLALAIRARLKGEGCDHGPISVRYELEQMGIAAPSRATLARIFTRYGVVAPEPKKRPRGSYIRFRYAAPNELWQIDATDWTLADGTVVAIFQVTDDHARLEIASLAARSENADDALKVVRIGIAQHGVPQRLLSDNGTALNPSRRGWIGQLTAEMLALGVTPIASSVAHPQTQGKNERSHSTLKRWLRARPTAEDLPSLQAQLDEFNTYYNERRPHQALQMMTPMACYYATPKAPAPTPPDAPQRRPELTSHSRTVGPQGIIRVATFRIMIGQENAGRQVSIVLDDTTIFIFDDRGTLTHTLDRPAPKSYIPNGKPRGFMANHQPSANPET